MNHDPLNLRLVLHQLFGMSATIKLAICTDCTKIFLRWLDHGELPRQPPGLTIDPGPASQKVHGEMVVDPEPLLNHDFLAIAEANRFVPIHQKETLPTTIEGLLHESNIHPIEFIYHPLGIGMFEFVDSFARDQVVGTTFQLDDEDTIISFVPCNTPDVTFHICNSNSCHFRLCVMIFPPWSGFCLSFCILFLSCISYHVIMCIAFAYVFVSCIRAFSPRSVLQSGAPISSGAPLLFSFVSGCLTFLEWTEACQVALVYHR